MKRLPLFLLLMIMILLLAGCLNTQEDMGISLESFINGFNANTIQYGIDAISLDEYQKGDDGGKIMKTLELGTNFYVAATGKGNVASIQIFLPASSLSDDALQELQNTALACIQTLDSGISADIISKTGLTDISKSSKTLQDNKEAYYLYFYDTNSRQVDFVHGKQYRLWYDNGIKYTILYPLQE
jgi:hypothetical protein